MMEEPEKPVNMLLLRSALNSRSCAGAASSASSASGAAASLLANKPVADSASAALADSSDWMRESRACAG